MILHEMLLPTADNDGQEYPHRVLSDFLGGVARIAGGYTLMHNADGFWRDPVNGRAFSDIVTPLRVGVENERQWSDIVRLAVQTWPDQEAVMHYIVSTEVTLTRTDEGAHA